MFLHLLNVLTNLTTAFGAYLTHSYIGSFMSFFQSPVNVFLITLFSFPLIHSLEQLIIVYYLSLKLFIFIYIMKFDAEEL